MFFLFAVLIFTVWPPMCTRSDHSKLLRTGEPASATIVDIADTGGTINQQPIFTFTLDIHRGDGNRLRPRSRRR